VNIFIGKERNNKQLSRPKGFEEKLYADLRNKVGENYTLGNDQPIGSGKAGIIFHKSLMLLSPIKKYPRIKSAISKVVPLYLSITSVLFSHKLLLFTDSCYGAMFIPIVSGV